MIERRRYNRLRVYTMWFFFLLLKRMHMYTVEEELLLYTVFYFTTDLEQTLSLC